jgi:hypothetical protein
MNRRDIYDYFSTGINRLAKETDYLYISLEIRAVKTKPKIFRYESIDTMNSSYHIGENSLTIRYKDDTTTYIYNFSHIIRIRFKLESEPTDLS